MKAIHKRVSFEQAHELVKERAFVSFLMDVKIGGRTLTLKLDRKDLMGELRSGIGSGKKIRITDLSNGDVYFTAAGAGTRG